MHATKWSYLDVIITFVHFSSLPSQVDAENVSLLRATQDHGRKFEGITSFVLPSSVALSGVALGGPVGSTGLLKIVLVDDIAEKENTLLLEISFKLRPCHPGFTNIQNEVRIPL